MIRITPVAERLIGIIWVMGLPVCLLPSAVHAACPLWNVSGDWQIIQSNDATTKYKFQQSGNGFKGTARYDYVHKSKCIFLVQCGDGYYHHTASVDGEIDGQSIRFTAYWSNGWIGYYEGTINNQGRMKGTGYERRSPDTVVTWYSDRTAECTSNSGGALSSGGNEGTIKAQGRVKAATPGPALEVCDAARKATRRNSPAAPGLRKKCLAAGGNADPLERAK